MKRSLHPVFAARHLAETGMLLKNPKRHLRILSTDLVRLRPYGRCRGLKHSLVRNKAEIVFFGASQTIRLFYMLPIHWYRRDVYFACIVKKSQLTS